MEMADTRHFGTKVVAVITLGGLWLGPALLAQPQPQPEFDPDSANHGAARISIMTGDVSVRRGDNGDYVAAAINAPLVVGDRVLTGANGYAEVQFDAANLIRVGPLSEIRLAELAYQ